MSIARVLSIIAGVLVAALTGGCQQENRSGLRPLRLALTQVDELVTNAGSDSSLGLALAPDGRRLVFQAAPDGEAELWVRDLETGAIERLEGTERAMLPFWAADGAAVAFFADGKLRRLTVADGSIRDLADAPLPRGGTWYPNGDILFAPDDAGLWWRRADGSIEPFTALDGGETSHRHPRALAGGEHAIFFVQAPAPTRQGIWMAPLADPARRVRLVGSDAVGLPMDDILLYSSGGALVAQTLDADRLALTGKPILVGTAVGSDPTHQLLATAGADVLIFGAPPSRLRALRWYDRAGTVTGDLGEPMEAWDVRLAPRGNAAAVTRRDPQLGTLDVWIYEGERPIPRRLSSNIDADEAPAWSRDARRVAWVSARQVVTIRDAQSGTPDVSLHKFNDPLRVSDWSGEWLILATQPGRGDIHLLPAREGGAPRPYVATPFGESHGIVSPDGSWLAYVSDESGRPEIYADAFPSPRRRTRLTLGGGTEPRWGQDARELFFRRGSEIHAVRVRVADGGLEADSSERLFDAGGDIRSFDVSPDGPVPAQPPGGRGKPAAADGHRPPQCAPPAAARHRRSTARLTPRD